MTVIACAEWHRSPKMRHITEQSYELAIRSQHLLSERRLIDWLPSRERLMYAFSIARQWRWLRYAI
jgi:hypothetical protein